jgi:hypothetical protein
VPWALLEVLLTRMDKGGYSGEARTSIASAGGAELERGDLRTKFLYLHGF